MLHQLEDPQDTYHPHHHDGPEEGCNILVLRGIHPHDDGDEVRDEADQVDDVERLAPEFALVGRKDEAYDELECEERDADVIKDVQSWVRDILVHRCIDSLEHIFTTAGHLTPCGEMNKF